MKRVKHIGDIASDSGVLVIADPSYLKAWKNDEPSGTFAHDLKQARGKPIEEDVPFSLTGAIIGANSDKKASMLMKWAGSSILTGEGEGGVYPVFVEYNRFGHVEKVMIRFLPEEEEDEYIPPVELVGEPPMQYSASTEIQPSRLGGMFKRKKD